ncbi:hypothetical protein M011DRAFT_486783 [Sporormia fimetaria CBS 119925]|uniref:Uncharacterized protein n=1 Tax=Sporormia fimetaria CBS 119925 TaxID=1340428 RepID=A0A6A6VBM6_9PLEO|nr:hypothetical protein M011DRAFT_486783 [Sporormia fimetaria CBS 119925]
MLAGPPRLVSLLTLCLLFTVGWWYFRVTITSGHDGLSIPGSSASRSKQSRVDPLDFSIPLRFEEGQEKAVGENYTYTIVIGKLKKDDLGWMQRELGGQTWSQVKVYEVEDAGKKGEIPRNKGREAMVYLTYLIDHYEELPEVVIFLHAHKYAWHNNQLSSLSAVHMLKRLNHGRIARLGYMNLRCHHKPGCPDWIHLDRPGADFDFINKPEEIYWRRSVWEELHPGAPLPASLSGVCCAQFAVSRDRLRQIAKERLLHYRKWLLETNIPDQFSGRVFEYLWHYIFTGKEVLCPAENTCYCDGYGYCFGNKQKFEAFFALQDERNKFNEELAPFTRKEDRARKEGQKIDWDEESRKRIKELRDKISSMDTELDALRRRAEERGRDEGSRREEREMWDREDLWDYAPAGKKGPPVHGTEKEFE